MENGSIHSKVITGTIDTIKWIHHVTVSPIIDVVNPVGIISSVVPQRIREFSKVLGNLSFNFAGLLNSTLGFKLMKSWLKTCETLALCISSPECRNTHEQSSVSMKLLFKALNTNESKEFINHLPVVFYGFLDAISNQHCKDLIEDVKKSTINAIELMNSPEGDIMIKEFYSKLDSALKVEYIPPNIDENTVIIEEKPIIIQKNKIEYIPFVTSMIFMFFAINGFLDWVSKFYR
jgi:hypothetical protein